MAMQLRRCFGTIHFGHLSERYDELITGENSESMILVLEKLIANLDDAYTAGAFAVEAGEVAGRIHIQFYVEHKPKRLSTLAKDFGVTTNACFDVVKSAGHAWDYCAGLGDHASKQAFKRLTFGEPKLSGTLAKVALNDLVNLIISGITLKEIMKAHPYAYCVHRDRLRKFYEDWNGLMF